MAGRLERGEVRLIRFPAPDKERPALILTRGSAIPYLSWVTVALIISSIRGVPSEVVLDVDDGMKQRCAVNLHNMATVNQAATGRRLAQLGEARMRAVCRAIDFALGCQD